MEHYINIGQVDEIFNNEKLTNGILSLINKNSEDYYKNKNDVLFNLISFYFRSRISDIQLQNRLLEIQKEQEIKLKEQEIKLKEQEIKLIHKHYLDSKEYKLGKYINKVFSIFFPLDTVHRKIVIFVIKKIIFMLKDIHKMYHKKKIPISYNKIISSNKKIYILAVPDGYIPSSELAITIPFNYLKKEKIINYHIKLVDDVKKKDIEKADIVFFLG